MLLNALEHGTAGAAGRAQRTGVLRHTGHLGISLVIWCAHGSCNCDAERAQLVAQAVARNAEDLGRLQLVPPGVTEHQGEQLPLHRGQRCGVGSIRSAQWPAARVLRAPAGIHDLQAGIEKGLGSLLERNLGMAT
jgi:hypothetical protein